jgi:hypothetical protein
LTNTLCVVEPTKGFEPTAAAFAAARSGFLTHTLTQLIHSCLAVLGWLRTKRSLLEAVSTSMTMLLLLVLLLVCLPAVGVQAVRAFV